MGFILTEVTGELAKGWIESWVEYLQYYLDKQESLLNNHDNDLFTDSIAWMCFGAALGFSIVNWFVI